MAPVMERGLRVYCRRPGWEEDECFLTDQLKRLDSPEAFVAAVWLSLIFYEWNAGRFLSAGAYAAVIDYSAYAAERGFLSSIVGAMFLLKRSARLKE
ncbi:MAG: hypothetical protein WC246_00070 [Candidatus Paceibacterota bacterium]